MAPSTPGSASVGPTPMAGRDDRFSPSFGIDESDVAEGIPEIHDALPAMAVEMATKTSLEDALPASAGDQTPDACTTAKGGST